MRKLKIGIVGGGHIVTTKHLPVLRKIGHAEVFAICDKNKSVAQDVARRFGVDCYFDSFSRMLKEQQLDVVDICTPIPTHAPLAIEAMESGCHVLVEKPLAMNVTDVDKMYQVSENKNVKLCVIHQNIFNPVVKKARRLVEEGAVGDLLTIDVGTFVTRDYHLLSSRNHWVYELPGGIFFETLPHPVYLLQLFLGRIEPTYVVREKLHFDWMKADEIKVLFKGEKGLGSLIGSCNSPYHGDSLNILGTKLGLQIDLWARSLVKYRRRTESPYSIGKSNLRIAFQSLSLVGTTIKNAVIMTIGGAKVSAHYEFIKRFLDCILADSAPPVSRSEAKETVRIVEALCGTVDQCLKPHSVAV